MLSISTVQRDDQIQVWAYESSFFADGQRGRVMEGHGCLKQRFYTSRFLTSSFYPDRVKDLSPVELQLHSTMGVGEQGKQGIGHLQESLFSTVLSPGKPPLL